MRPLTGTSQPPAKSRFWGTRCEGRVSPRRADSAVAVPLLEIGERVEGRAPFVPARRRPHLEVEVAADRVAGFADDPDLLAGAHDVARMERRGFGQVGVHEVVARPAPVDDEVVAGGT